MCNNEQAVLVFCRNELDNQNYMYNLRSGIYTFLRCFTQSTMINERFHVLEKTSLRVWASDFAFPFFYLLLFYTCTPAAAENYINYGTISVFGWVLYVYSIHSSDEIRMTCKTNNNQMLAQPRWHRAQVSLKFKFIRIECGLKAAADACKHKNFQCHNNATRKKLCRQSGLFLLVAVLDTTTGERHRCAHTMPENL